MPNGNLLISPGMGNATIFDSSPAVQNFAAIMQQKQAKRQQELNDLSAEFSKVSPAGIREPDRQGYMDKYMALQALGRQKINEKDPYKKAMIQADIDRGFQDLGAYVSDSKQEAQQYQWINRQLQSNKQFHDSLDDNAVQRIIESNRLPMNHKDYLKSGDFGTLQRRPDMDKFRTDLTKLNDELYKNTSYDTDPITGKYMPPREEKVPGGTNRYSAQVVDPRKQALYYAMMLDAAHMQAARASYPQLSAQFPDDQQFKAAVVPQMVKDNPLRKEDKPQFDKDDNFYRHWNYEIEHPKADATNPPATPQGTQLIPFGKGGHYQAKNFVPVSLPNKNFAGTPAIDLDTGKPIKALSPSDDYSIVGVQDVPVSTVTGQIAQPNWEQQHPDKLEHKRMVQIQQKGIDGNMHHYLIDYDKLPANVANQKDVHQALKKLNQTPVYGNEDKVVTEQQVRALMSKPGWKGHSLDEIKEYLRSQGITVQ